MYMQAAALLRLLGDPTRLRLLRVLAADSLNVSELTGVLGVAQSGVSRHLGLLKEAGLVAEERAGAFTWYRLSDSVRQRQRFHGAASRVARRGVQAPAPRRRAATMRGWRKCGACGKKIFRRMRCPAKNAGSWCPAGAGRPGRGRLDC